MITAFSRWYLLCLTFALGLLAPSLHAAVGLNVTPAQAAYNHTGNIEVQITGLTNTQQVILQQYLDINANGAVEETDLLVGQFPLQDGRLPRFGGVRNTNALGDEDDAANGQITARFSLKALPEASRAVAKYAYRVIPASAGFAPVTDTFEVVEPVTLQRVQGQVTAGGQPVPFALVIALVAAEDDMDTFAGIVANASGQYSLGLPTGQYTLIAVRPGYAADFENAAMVNLTANANLTANLTSLVTTRTISGRMQDADTGVGLGGVQVIFSTEDDKVTLGVTEADGSFEMGVPTGPMYVELSESSLNLMGYVGFSDDTEVDTTAGDISGQIVELPAVNAVVYGRLTDAEGEGISDVEIYASTTTQTYNTFGMTDTNGNYTIGLSADTWWISPSSEDLMDLGFSGISSQQRTLTTNQAVELDFQVQAVTARLTGQVVDNGGQPVGNVNLFAFESTTSNSANGETDGNGFFDFGLTAGTWQLGLSNDDAQERNLIAPYRSVTLVDGATSNIVYVVQIANRRIAGFVRNPQNVGLGGVQIFAFANVNGASYNANTTTAADGSYQLPVIDGSWQVGLSCQSLNQQGYECVPNSTTNIAGANVTVNFTVQPAGALTIMEFGLQNGEVGSPYQSSIIVTGGLQPYSFALAPGSGPLPPGLQLSSPFGNFGTVSGTPTTAGTYNFVVRVTDAAAATDDQAFSLQVTGAAQPPEIISFVAMGGGQYRLRFNAQVGTVYAIETSTNLTSWDPLTSFTAQSTVAEVFDNPAAGNAVRFYRVRVGN